MTGALLSALLLTAFALAPKARAADCVDDAKWNAVAGYYDSNKANSPNYGANWYRVLIAYRQEDPERALPTWAGATAKPTAPFTVDEAVDQEKVWSGWTPVRKALKCLEKEPGPPPLPDAAAPSVLINAIADGDEGTTAPLSATLSGGNYDGAPEHAWTVSKGTLDDPTLASPTWTRPAVDSDASIVVSLSLTVKGSGTNARSGTSATANAGASVLVRDNPPPPPPPSDPAPPPSSCVSDEQWDAVEGYYNANRNKSNRNYGENWYRVLIAYRQERSDKTLPTWAGATAKPTAPLSVGEAADGEEVWEGWTAVREVLECLNPPQPQRSSQQDQQITTYTVTISMPDEVSEGAKGNPTFHWRPGISPAPPHNIKLRVKAPDSAGTARPTNFSNGNPVWSDGSANPNWDYALFSGKFNVGFILNINPGKTRTAESLGITIHSDDVYEGDETIGLEVSCESGCGGGTGDNYVVNVVNDTTPTIIKDDDPKPILSISANSEVTEGDPIKATITADRAAQSDYTFLVKVRDNNISLGKRDKRAVDNASISVTMKAYETEASISVPTFEHTDIEDRGAGVFIGAPLSTDPYLTSATDVSAKVSVKDKLDAYTLTVRVPSTFTTEGSGTGNRAFTATMTLDRPIGQNLTLTVQRHTSVDTGGRDLAKGVSIHCQHVEDIHVRTPPTADAVDWDYGFCGNVDDYKVTIPKGETVGNLDIIIHEDDIYEGDEVLAFLVTCDIVANNTNGCGDSLYKVNIWHLGNIVVITNDEPRPDIAISAEGVTEGEDIIVTLGADRKAQNPYDILVHVFKHGEFFKNITVTMPSLAETTAFTLNNPADDESYEHVRYAFRMQIVSDGPFTAETHAINVDSYDAIKPVVSTSADSIEEGETLKVNITADRAHIVDYDIRIILSGYGPDNIIEIGAHSQRTVTMPAGKTKVVVTYGTTNNSRRDGNYNAVALIQNNTADSLWSKGAETRFNITDSGDSHIPIIGFKTLTDPQQHVCANTTNTTLFDEGLEGVDNFECNLSVEEGPNTAYEFCLNYEVSSFGKQPTNGCLNLTIDSTNRNNFSAELQSGIFADHPHIDQGDSYQTTIRLLPSSEYSLTSFNETFIKLIDEHDAFGSGQKVTVSHRIYGSGESFANNIFVDLEDILGEILEVEIQTSIAYHESLQFGVLLFDHGGEAAELIDADSDLIDSTLSTDSKFVFKQKAFMRPFERKTYYRIPLRDTLLEKERDFGDDGFYRTIVSTTAGMENENCSNCPGGGDHITYTVYPPPPPPPVLGPDHPDYIGPEPWNYTAKQCVEKNIPKNITCGSGGKKIIIEMPAADEIIEGAGDGYAYLYPSSGLPEKVKVRVTRKDKNSDDVQETDIDVPPTGLKHNLGLNNDKDERDRGFEYSFQVVGGTTWQIHPDNAKKSIKVIDDEPTVFEWTPNTLTNTPDEGGFQRIAKIAVLKRPNGEGGVGSTDADKNAFWQPSDIITWNFNLGGDVSLKNIPPKNCLHASDKVACNKLPSQDPKGVAEAVMPVWLDFDNSATNPKVTRTGLDSFKETGRSGVGNGWQMDLMVGEDSNTVDEIMTANPEIILSQSGGGAAFSSRYPFPSEFIIYDDDGASDVTVDDPDFNDDTVYVSFTNDSYQAIEGGGPSQPVIHYYNKDNNGNRVDLCARNNNQPNCKRSTTLKDTARIFVNVLTTGTATRGELSLAGDKTDKVSDFYSDAKPDLLLPPGWDLHAAKFDMGINSNDDDHVDVYKAWIANGRPSRTHSLYDPSGDETVELAIDTASLPTGIQVDPNGHGSATVTIINSEQDVVDRENAQAQANKCDPDHDDYDATADCNKPAIEVTGVSAGGRNFLNENALGDVAVNFRNTSATHSLVGKHLKFKMNGPCVTNGNEVPWGVGPAHLGPGGSVGANVLLQLGVNIDANAFNDNDNSDCIISFSMRQSADYVVSGTPKTFTIKDTDPTSVYLNNGRKADAAASHDVSDNSKERPLSMAIFLRRAVHENGVVTSGSNRRLTAGEVVEVPIKARLSGGSTELTTDDFLISAFENQSNLAIKELPGKAGYSVRMRHVPSAPATNCHSNTAGTANNINHVACLSLSTTMDLEDDTEQSIDVYVDYADGNFGDTNLSGGFANLSGDGTQSSSVTFNVKGFGPEVGNQYGAQADAKTLTLYVKQTEVEEPEPNEGPSFAKDQNWIDIPMDVVMNPGPSSYEDTSYDPSITRNRVTRFHFCIEKDGTTASYHHDWRIVHELEHLHDAAVGGYAWDSNTGCTKKGGIFTREIKKRFYLRVHGDHDAENDETIALKLKMESTDDNVTADVSATTVTIKDAAAKSKRARVLDVPSASPAPEGASPSASGTDDASAVGIGAVGGPRWSFRQYWYEGGTHFRDGEGFDEAGIQNALYAMLEISLVTAHDPAAAIPYGEADRGVCLDPAEVPSRLEFEGFSLRPLKWRDAPDPHLCRSFLDFENNGSWLADDGLLVNEWGMHVRLGIVDDDEANGDEETPAGFPFILDNPAFPVDVDGGTLDMDTFIILDDDDAGPQRVF